MGHTPNHKLAVKICGVMDLLSLKTAAQNGARYVGFVFAANSVRALEIDIAKELSLAAPTGVKTVGLFVNPDDMLLDKVLPYVMLDYIQLHGDETPQRVKDIRVKYGLPVIKALPIASQHDLMIANDYSDAANMLLLDAKAEGGSFGGSGKSFDWDILKSFAPSLPWLLAGGLKASNIVQALDICTKLPHFAGVDVSSGVEREKGQKDSALMIEFLNICKAYNHAEK